MASSNFMTPVTQHQNAVKKNFKLIKWKNLLLKNKIQIELKKSNMEACSDIVGECDSTQGLLCVTNADATKNCS